MRKKQYAPQKSAVCMSVCLRTDVHTSQMRFAAVIFFFFCLCIFPHLRARSSAHLWGVTAGLGGCLPGLPGLTARPACVSSPACRWEPPSWDNWPSGPPLLPAIQPPTPTQTHWGGRRAIHVCDLAAALFWAPTPSETRPRIHYHWRFRLRWWFVL